MNILVCAKQVPDTTEIKIDPVTNTLIREGVPSVLNPYDGYALEAAARIKDKDPETKIVVLTMGPEAAKAVSKECLAIAADKAYLVSGRTFAGSDTLATSYILYNAVKKLEEAEGKFDFIFCGKQAIDGDTAQVGPEMAEWLGYGQITNGLECEMKDGKLEVLKEGADYNYVMSIAAPAVVTFTKPSFDPRFPTIKRKMAANKAVIEVLGDGFSDEMDGTKIGLKGSPTFVRKSFTPPVAAGGEILKGETPEDTVKMLVGKLTENHVI